MRPRLHLGEQLQPPPPRSALTASPTVTGTAPGPSVLLGPGADLHFCWANDHTSETPTTQPIYEQGQPPPQPLQLAGLLDIRFTRFVSLSLTACGGSSRSS